MIEGCRNADLQYRVFNLELSNIINPYMVRPTSMFKIQIYKEWDAATNTPLKEIMSLTDYFLPASFFSTNSMVLVSFINSNYIVQEQGTVTLKFRMATDLPGTSVAAGMMNAVHIRFPSAFTMPSNTGQPTLSGSSSGSITLISFIRDSEPTYDEDCIT